MNEDVRLEKKLTLPNDLADVPLLEDFVEEVSEAAGLDMSTTLQLNLALEEAVVNVMEYAYPEGFKGKLCIEALVHSSNLQLIITDEGRPFDPTKTADVDVTLSAEERPIGGLGIYLVRQIMDTVSYARVGGKNVLTLTKKL